MTTPTTLRPRLRPILEMIHQGRTCQALGALNRVLAAVAGAHTEALGNAVWMVVGSLDQDATIEQLEQAVLEWCGAHIQAALDPDDLAKARICRALGLHPAASMASIAAAVEAAMRKRRAA